MSKPRLDVALFALATLLAAAAAVVEYVRRDHVPLGLAAATALMAVLTAQAVRRSRSGPASTR